MPSVIHVRAVQWSNFLYSHFQQSEKNEYELSIGTKLFLDQSAKIMPEFQKNLLSYYNSSVDKVDFKQSAAAISAINSWCSDVTKGKITQLVNMGTYYHW